MYTLTFTLKQHTPIIHFQHDQDGATLRATEVKPKLDRFIIEKMGGWENFKKVHFDWLVGNGEHAALNYKLSIETSIRPSVVKIEKNYPCYLGNMGKTIDSKDFVFCKLLTIRFLFYSETLRNEIQKNISSFFSCHNFGNRTSKGFGCFTLSETSQLSFEKEIKEHFSTVYKMNWKSQPVEIINDHKFLFRKIQDEYKILKAGDSRNKKDSKLREYVNRLSSPIEWEKPIINTDIQRITKRNLNIQWRNKNFQYVRSLLGLADHYEYMQFKITVHFTPKDTDLNRFPSPIVFKVYENILYIAGSNSTRITNIKEKEVMISYKEKGEIINGLNTLIKIPDFNFDICDFLNFALNNTNWKKI